MPDVRRWRSTVLGPGQERVYSPVADLTVPGQARAVHQWQPIPRCHAVSARLCCWQSGRTTRSAAARPPGTCPAPQPKPRSPGNAPDYSGADSLSAYGLLGAGHDINLATGAPQWFTAAYQWIAQRVAARR